MIGETRFWGIDLAARGRRRGLVVSFYLFIALMLGFGLWKGHRSLMPLVTMTLVLGGMLGGIKQGGPVKAYSRSAPPLDMGETVQELGLTEAMRGRAARRSRGADSTWDEREMQARDAAHFAAYRILRWGLGGAAMLYGVGLAWFAPWVESRSPVLLWVLVVAVLSLPQAVILWREPEVRGA